MDRLCNMVVSTFVTLCLASGVYATDQSINNAFDDQSIEDTSKGEASGGLLWDQLTLSPTVTIGDTEAVGIFRFKNTGDQPVTILKTHSGCGCTTVDIEGRVYQPGESGEVAITFSFDGRVGKQTKEVLITTDASRKPVTWLTLSVKIPELVRIQPKLVYWKADEPREPKKVAVEVVHDEPVRIVGAEVAGESVVTQVNEVKEGEFYEVLVTPTGEAGRAAITLKTDVPEDKPMEFLVIARVIRD